MNLQTCRTNAESWQPQQALLSHEVYLSSQLPSLIPFIGYSNQTVSRFYRAGDEENLNYWRLYGDLEVKFSFLPELEGNSSFL